VRDRANERTHHVRRNGSSRLLTSFGGEVQQRPGEPPVDGDHALRHAQRGAHGVGHLPVQEHVPVLGVGPAAARYYQHKNDGGQSKEFFAVHGGAGDRVRGCSEAGGSLQVLYVYILAYLGVVGDQIPRVPQFYYGSSGKSYSY
jgi:hypothetical protein